MPKIYPFEIHFVILFLHINLKNILIKADIKVFRLISFDNSVTVILQVCKVARGNQSLVKTDDAKGMKIELLSSMKLPRPLI